VCVSPPGRSQRYFTALRELDGSELPVRVTPVCVGDALPLRDGRHVVRPFATKHPVPSNGYVVFSRRAKLRAQYAGLDGKAIAALRAGGETVSDTIEAPLLAFTGDTSADWVTHPSAEQALRAKLLIVECTFVDGAPRRTHVPGPISHGCSQD
jgi:ribonuclease Z